MLLLKNEYISGKYKRQVGNFISSSPKMSKFKDYLTKFSPKSHCRQSLLKVVHGFLPYDIGIVSVEIREYNKTFIITMSYPKFDIAG